MSDVEVDPFDFINAEADGAPAEEVSTSQSLSVDPFDFINAEPDEENKTEDEAEESFEEVDEPEAPAATESKPIAAINKPVIALTPTGTPTYAQAARSRPTSECVPNEPVVEDPEIEDVVVEDVVEEAPKVSQVQAEPAAPAEAKAPEGDKEQGESKQSRAERKTKKAMQKLGLAQVEGINRVVLRKDKSLLFVVPNPEVFRRGDTWVVLGEARVEDPGQRAREMAAQNMAQKEVQKEKIEKPAAIPEVVEEEEEISAEGVEEKDVELVMQQSGCSKAKAIAALKNNQNDIVNAIMELTV